MRKKNNHVVEKILILCMLLLVVVGSLYANKEIGKDKNPVAQEATYTNVQPKPTTVQANTSKEAQSDSSKTQVDSSITQANAVKDYKFKSASLLQEHFGKHGGEFGYTSTDQYVSGANAVIYSPDALHKTESKDGDDVYYLQKSNEFVVLSTEGFIRTYFKPDDGIAYYNKQ